MSFNFNDPAGVQALLDQIKSSSAWQELSATSAGSSDTTPLPDNEPITKKHPTEPSSGRSVTALLSQLQSPPEAWNPSTNVIIDLTTQATSLQRVPPQSPPVRPTTADPTISGKDVHLLSVDESLPILLRLLQEPSFVNELRKIKQDQDALERQLWKERRSVHKEYEDKLKAATTKANIIGVSISKHEAETLVDAYNKQLRKFDRNRALPAWDGLVARQQAKLQRLQVPTMHVTSDPSVLKSQQHVLQILSSIIGPSAK